MTIGELYQQVSYYFNSDSEIIRSRIERLVMVESRLSWKDNLTDDNIKLIREV